jgi:EmrB/QacA subfamily drug resistance transporter
VVSDHKEMTGSARKWYVMAAVSMGVFLATIDGSIVNVALPTLMNELQAGFAVVQWVVLAYLLTVCTLLLGIGRWADIVGKKSIYLSGIAIFTLSSGLCGMMPNVYLLIACRVIQAVGAAMITALGMAIVTEAFSVQERGRAMGVIGMMVSIGVIAGPTLGGLILSVLSWHWIFFVNIPVGILGTILVFRFVPSNRPSGGEQFDFLGSVLWFATLLTFLLALTLGQTYGFSDSRALGLFAGAALLLGLFIRAEKGNAQPMIDLRMFANGMFSINLITGLLTFIASAGTVLLMPFYLENVLGYNPQTVGLLLAVVPLAVGVVAPIAGSLSDRFGTRPLTALGLLILMGGYAAVATLDLHTTAWGYVLRFLPLGVGAGLFQSPNNSAVMGSAPRSRLGVASGLLSITRTLGQTTGVAVMGAIWASRMAAKIGQPVTDLNAKISADIQVEAMNETSLVIVGMMAVALLLSLYNLYQDQILRKAQQSSSN